MQHSNKKSIYELLFGKQTGADQNHGNAKSNIDTNEASGKSWDNTVINLFETFKFPYFETTGLFNLHLIHIDDSNTLTAERVQGEPEEKTGGKHNMKVEHDNIKQNAQGTVGTNENLRDHIDGIKCRN